MKIAPLLVVGFVAAGLISSCQQDPQSANRLKDTPSFSPNGSNAQPAVAYNATASVTSHHNTTIYFTIAVMDSDGTHQTNIVTAASDVNTEKLVTPTWNSSGTSIGYEDVSASLYNSTGGVNPSYIKAVDVSVNSSGVPVGSNVRTIYSLSTSDSATMFSRPMWCSVSSTAKLVFVRDYVGSRLNQSELCTVSESGGTPVVLSTFHGTYKHPYIWPAWSPDDSKIAVVRVDSLGSTINHMHIIIFNASTGAALDSIAFNAKNIGGLEWSRTGTNELVFSAFTSGSGPYVLYYCSPTTGSTPSTNSVSGYSGTWSPNNSSVLYVNTATNALLKNIPQTGTTSTVQSSFYGAANGMNWKR